MDNDKTIKVLYPIKGDKKFLFQNEVKILKKLNERLGDPLKNGIVKLIANCNGDGIWINLDDFGRIPGFCSAIVYAYGEPLFPVLRRCIRKMLFWYFSQMVSCVQVF